MIRFMRLSVLILMTLLTLTACTPNSLALITPGSFPNATAPTPALIGTGTPVATLSPTQPVVTATTATTATTTSAASATATRPIARAATRTIPASLAAQPQNVIRFSAFENSPNEAKLAAIRPDGTGRGAIDLLPKGIWAPRFSPDGAQLLFSTTAPTASGRALDLDLNGTDSPDIWIAQADGSQARQLIGGAGSYNGWNWSPDSRQIVFTSNRSGSWDIYSMAANGTGITRLTTSPSQDGWPTWMPDGATIVFASTRSDQAQLYRLDTRGGDIQRLLATSTADTEPAIARNGNVAFSAQSADGSSEIVVVESSGSSPRKLTALGGLSSAPTWSPDSTRLAFISAREGHSDLFVVNADGSGLQRLTTTGQNQRPDWGSAPADRLTLLAQQNVFQAVGRLHSGTIEAITDDGKGTRITSTVRFDLGEQPADTRLQTTTTRAGPGSTTSEQTIIVGDRAWQRQTSQPWRTVTAASDVQAQINALLPQIDLAQQLTADLFVTQVELRWTDRNGVSVTLLANALEGTPIQMTVIDRQAGSQTTVRYNWKPPGTIAAPALP
jgi:dipeptidyl aminopeptidase/acylaminoacyl peptidase